MNLTALVNLGLKAIGAVALFAAFLAFICVIAGAREERRMEQEIRRIRYDYPENN